MEERTPGTFFYSSNPAGWNMPDQIMVSKGLLTGSNGLEDIDDSFEIFALKE